MTFNLKNNRIISGPNLFPAPRKDRPTRRETFYLVSCNYCGKTRWLRKTDMLKDSPCRSCSAVINSTRSSELEDTIADFLSNEGVEYERHVPYIDDEVRYNIDFHLTLHNVYLEVVGYWHTITKRCKDVKLVKRIKVFFVSTIDEVKEILNGLRSM